MDKREHAVLSLFYEEGKREVTPSLLAYRMRMNAKDAAKLLDGMVKKDVLNLHVDDEGHISYRLPPSERHRIGSQTSRNSGGRRDQQPSESGDRRQLRERPDDRHHQDRRHQTNDNSSNRRQPPPGTDASTGHTGDSRSQVPGSSTRRHSGPEGTDGSVGPGSGPVVGEHSRRPDNSGGAPRYEDWYGDGQSRTNDQQHQHQQHHRHQQQQPPTGGQWTEPEPEARRSGRPADRGGPQTRTRRQPEGPSRQQQQFQERQQLQQRGLTPYQDDQPPATRQPGARKRDRVPVLAGALSLLIPGLGQFYNGEITKGVMLLFSYVFLLLFWLFWIVHIWSIIDAYMVAEQSNQSLPEDSDQGQRPMLPEQPGQSTNPNSTAA